MSKPKVSKMTGTPSCVLVVFLVLGFFSTFFSNLPISSQIEHAKAASAAASPGTIINLARGQASWNNPENAAANDGVYTGAPNGGNSDYLYATNFGFAIPAGATVTGVKAEVNWYHPGGTASDDVWNIAGDGIMGMANKTVGTVAPTTDDGSYVAAGGDGDMWPYGPGPDPEIITSAVVNDADFGFMFSVKDIYNMEWAYVDHMRMTVYYTPSVVVPTVTTSAATDVAATSVTGNGEVTADGGDTVTGRGFYRAADSSVGHDCSDLGGATQVTAGSGVGVYSASIGSLTASTYYCYNSYATNSAGTGYGTWTPFQTLATYTLTYNAGANGSIVGTTPQTVDYGADGAEVTATPAAHYHFVSWSDAYPTAARTDLNVTGDITVTASFAIDTYTVTISADGTGTGSTDPTSIDVNYGANLDITATPDASSDFTAWTGCDSVDANVCHLTGIAANRTPTATFTLKSFTLAYSAGANGSIVGATPQTVDYGANGAEVTATPDANYHFVQWSDAVMTAARTDLNITGNITVTASFAIDTYTLTYNAGANGSITGTTPQTVDYGANGAEVTATPDANYHFVQWSDAVMTASRTDLNVVGDITVTASFAIDQYTLTYNAGANGSIGGISPQTVDYGANGAEVTATPDANYHFVQWSDAVMTAVRTDLNITGNITVTASFAIDTYTVTISSAGTGTGTFDQVSPVAVNYGDNLDITATPDLGSGLTSWAGCDSIDANVCHFVNITANQTPLATFDLALPPTVTTAAATAVASTSVTGHGEVTADGGATVTGRGFRNIIDNSVFHDCSTAAGGAQTTAGSGVGVYSTSIGSLNANTDYCYRAYATNSAGTSYGAWTSFQTTSPTVQFTATSSNAAESVTPANLEVTLSALSGSNISVDYAVTGGTATSGGTDYTLAVGTLTITAGNLTGNIQPTIVNDVLDENDETIIVTLSNPFNATLGANTGHTYTINDDDAAPTIQFTAISSNGDESVTPVNLEVSLSTASAKTISFSLVLTGTATYSQDYTINLAGLTLNPGDLTLNIPLTITDDALVEADETAILALSNPVNATLGANTQYTYTILNNDVAMPGGSNSVSYYAISATAGIGGTISPSGDVSIQSLYSQTFTITPNVGYHIKEVFIDGVASGSFNSYTFLLVNAVHTISATFEADQPVSETAVATETSPSTTVSTGRDNSGTNQATTESSTTLTPSNNPSKTSNSAKQEIIRVMAGLLNRPWFQMVVLSFFLGGLLWILVWRSRKG